MPRNSTGMTRFPHVLVRKLLACLNCDRQVILRGWQGTGGELRVGARQVHRPVEVEFYGAVRFWGRPLNRAVGWVRGDARGCVGEQDVQAARRVAVESG